MSAPIVFKVKFVETRRTDLMCVSCGGFKTQLALVTADRDDDEGAAAGIHRVCIDDMKVQRKEHA